MEIPPGLTKSNFIFSFLISFWWACSPVFSPSSSRHGRNRAWRAEYHAAHRHTFFVGIGGYLFDTFGPGYAFAIKGAANLVLCVWFFVVKEKIAAGK